MITYCTDWISATFKVSENINKYIFKLINEEKQQTNFNYRECKRVANFKNAIEIIDDGYIIGKFFYNNQINRLLGQLFITNEINYMMGYFSISEIIFKIQADLPVLFKKWCRIDLCIDFDADEKFLGIQREKFLEMFGKNEILRQRKFNKSNVNIVKKAGVIETIYFNKNSDIKIKIYNKSKELEKNKKFYILDFWKQNEMDMNFCIFRLEFSIHHLGTHGKKIFDKNNEDILKDIYFFDRGYMHIFKILQFLINEYMLFFNKNTLKWGRITDNFFTETCGGFYFLKPDKKITDLHPTTYSKGVENFLFKFAEIFEDDNSMAAAELLRTFNRQRLPVSNTGTPKIAKELKNNNLFTEKLKEVAKKLPKEKKCYLIENQGNGKWKIFEAKADLSSQKLKDNHININEL